MAISVHDTKEVKYCDHDETWWMPVPDDPIEVIVEIHDKEIESLEKEIDVIVPITKMSWSIYKERLMNNDNT
jgi:hypothetical protein